MLLEFDVERANQSSFNRKNLAPNSDIQQLFAAAKTNGRKTGDEMNPLSDTDPMPFGKHKGVLMQDVPAGYLHYLWQNGLKNDNRSNVADYIRRNLDALKKEHTDGIWT